MKRKGAQAVSRPPVIQDLSELSYNIASGLDEVGLIAERLSAHEDGISAGAKMAHEPKVREPARAREVAAGNRQDGIVVRTLPLPLDDPVPRRDQVRVDPRAGGPGGRESERLETIGVGEPGTVRITFLGVPVP